MALVAAVGLVLATPATAQTSTRYQATYYSNAQMDVVVGHVIITCDNQSYGDGYLTQFYEEQTWDC
jgi:hypothetical protein